MKVRVRLLTMVPCMAQTKQSKRRIVQAPAPPQQAAAPSQHAAAAEVPTRKRRVAVPNVPPDSWRRTSEPESSEAAGPSSSAPAADSAFGFADQLRQLFRASPESEFFVAFTLGRFQKMDRTIKLLHEHNQQLREIVARACARSSGGGGQLAATTMWLPCLALPLLFLHDSLYVLLPSLCVLESYTFCFITEPPSRMEDTGDHHAPKLLVARKVVYAPGSTQETAMVSPRKSEHFTEPVAQQVKRRVSFF